MLLGFACAVGVLLGAALDFSSYTSNSLLSNNKKKEKLARLIDYIEYEYVDDVNIDSIVDVTVNGILTDLDPHSVYIPQQEYASLSESMKGDFVGIGVSFYNVNDTIAVIQPLEGGPSEKVGIQGGDRILYANGKPLFNKNISNDSITEHLKGEENTKVVLKIYRKGVPELLEFNVRRGRVPLRSVDAAYMLAPHLGYIKINRFAESTYQEFRESLLELKQKGATQIALDLRNNPGGYLAEATQIVDEFLPDDKLILLTRNKKGAIEKTFATKKGNFEKGKLFVLINENSASASEIVAGALQDNDKGIIVGRRSYGKGLVQREMALGDGSAVRLTIARYYTPTGRSIQKPYDHGNEEYFNDYLNRYKNGELISADSISVADSLKYVTPGGKVVYGGGGIIPDVFVPKDTNFEKESLNLMLRSGYMDRFIFEVLENDRGYYNSLDFEEFLQTEMVSEEILQQFREFTRRENFQVKITEYRPVLKRYLKATMAQQLFGSNAFEQIVNEGDRMIEKVIELSSEE
ncbi:carboxyl-terminal processing protease [Salinimicrobium catena]|uniref:Carboxyl-terminal processing protease n=1 Tax=Salinimicrobium catena TaxID=390640 RepID=A0A1H5I2D9_9FLAO|nr:carboxyl-terminal processing protease [Salinimicrobium catena]SEE33658.1 carboxyl-terminal processing protease [Salinimicrobium catena]